MQEQIWKLNNATFVFEEKSGREIKWLSWLHRFVFRPYENAKPAFFKFLLLEERFRKAPFSWRISVEVGLAVEQSCVFKCFRPSCYVTLIYLEHDTIVFTEIAMYSDNDNKNLKYLYRAITTVPQMNK